MSEAVAKYQKLLEQYPNNELARFSLGKADFNAAEFAPAREQFELALARKPDWMVVQILIGKCNLALGNRASAKAAFERARQLAIEQNHEGQLEEKATMIRQIIVALTVMVYCRALRALIRPLPLPASAPGFRMSSAVFSMRARS